MKSLLSLIMAAGLFLYSEAGAFSDLGLVKGVKTLGYFMMPDAQFANISSGLIYDQKIDNHSAWQVMYTSYNSAYLLTSKITLLNLHKKQRLLRLGAFDLSGLYGLGLMYSPSVGGGLTGNLGGFASYRLQENLALSSPLLLTILNDGVIISLNGNLNYQPFFLNNYEIFGGYRFEAQILAADLTGRMNNFYYLGLRTAI